MAIEAFRKLAVARLMAVVVSLLLPWALRAELLPVNQEEGSDTAALVSYAAAVRLHIESDPVLAAAYLAFWHQLAQVGDLSGLDDEAAERFQVASRATAGALASQYLERRGDSRLVNVLSSLLVAIAAGESPAGASESLLAAVDRAIAPRVLVDGRYDFSAAMQAPAELGFGPDVWLRCRSSPACVAIHDELFAAAMADVSLEAGFTERMAQDGSLQTLPELPQLIAGIVGLDERLRAVGPDLPAVARAAANAYWQALGTGIAPALAGNGAPQGSEDLRALLTLGRVSAWVSGSPGMATSFAVIGPPMLEFARLASGALGGGAFLGATAGAGLLFAGVQALALFADGPAAPPPGLDNLVAELRESSQRNLVGLRAEGQLASNLLDTRLVRLGIALDVVKDDVAQIQTAQRARVRSDFLVQDARRWTGFEEENDRCFSLRTRSPATGRLQPADFRRCEERFLQGAVRRSQYATRARDFVLDARFLDAGDLRFPFRHQYPLLLTLNGMDSAAALALSDPLEWQQHAAALLRLYQENPAGPADFARRSEALRSLRAAGMRIHDALAGLAVRRDVLQAPAFNQAVHERALDDYFAALRALLRRVDALDDSAADTFGKRMTVGLDQSLPEGTRGAAIETILSGAREGSLALRPCSSSPDAAFLAPEAGLLAESRRFFAAPITAEELARSWNRDMVAGFDLRPVSHARLVPLPFLWAALDGHAELEVCLARFRPAVAEFTRDEMPLRDHLRASVEVDAAIDVRFTPGPELARELGLDASRQPIVIASYAASRRCSFGYRMDGEGCSRGQCLAQLAPMMWSADGNAAVNGGSCAGDPLPQQLARVNKLAHASELVDLGDALTGPYWRARDAQRARLEADVRRSSEFEAASALYLRYFALAGVTLAAWLDPTQPLGPLFAADDPVAPRAAMAGLLERRVPLAALEDELVGQREGILERVAARGREVAADDAFARLPHLMGLREPLSRIDLMLLAYQSAQPPP
jgi:hypothetical protein